MGFPAFVYREWLVFSRSKIDLWLTVLPPLITLLFFTVSMSNTIGNINGVPYTSFILPGIVLMFIMSSVAGAASRLFNELYSSSLLEYISLPATRGSYIRAKISTIILLSTVQGLVFLLAGGLAFSVEYSLLELLLGVLAVILITASLSSFFVFLALACKDMGAFLVLINVFTQIFTWSSSVFYPISAMPKTLQWLALINPVTYGVDLIRSALIFHHPTSTFGWVYLSAISLIFGTLAVRLLARRTALIVQS
ncbi:MAG: ABC transporter permease [Trueperaceae bacterium]